MSDPVLKSTKVVIHHLSSDGYRSEWTAKSGDGSRHRVTGEKTPPQNALLSALEELSRLTALYGFQDEALEVFNAARKRVSEPRTLAAVEGGAA